LIPNNTPLSRFKEAFFERYEQREVPLLQALDPECGIGYILDNENFDFNPLIDDIVLPHTNIRTGLSLNPVESFLLEKLVEAISEHRTEIELKENDLEPHLAEWDDLPDTFSVIAQVTRENKGTSPNYKIYISSAGGSSAANLLTRFCYADQMTKDLIKKIVDAEEKLQKRKILAEIVHLPESRAGNILLRPVFRQYEIPYFARSSAALDFQIELQDLYISIKGDSIKLRSQRLDKEVLPRLSTAHNYFSTSLPVYRFLCDLQTQNKKRGFGFSWGLFANNFEFLPRVTYKNLILSPAFWNIKTRNLGNILMIENEKKLLSGFKKWQKQTGIPYQVILVDGDTEMFLNFESILCLKMFWSMIKNRENFTLKEFLFDPKTAIVTGSRGAFNSEFIFTFFKKNTHNDGE
jgi:hypothetical protein